MQPTFSDVIQSDTPTLVDFYADWCGPCQQMKPILQEIKTNLGNRIRIIKVDVDRAQAAAQVYHIQSIPTLLLFKKGNIVWRNSGVVAAQQLQQIIQQHI